MRYWAIIFLLIAAPVWADSETRTAGSYDQGTNWTTPGNTTGAGDDVCAYYFTTTQDILTNYNYGFVNVEGTVDSITVTYDMSGESSTASDREIEAQLTKTGGTTNTGVGNLVEDIGGDQLANCGLSADRIVNGNVFMGAESFTPAQIKASGFGVNTADDDISQAFLDIDAVSITVYYTPDSGVKFIRIRK